MHPYQIIFLLTIFFNTVAHAQLTEPFEKAEFNWEKEVMPYRIMRPLDAKDGEKYPLVIFLHGSGERGNDNEKQLYHVVTEFSKRTKRADYPCFVVAPQCSLGKRWTEVDWNADKHVMSHTPSGELRMVKLLVDSLIKTNQIDPSRVYVMGLSMGGFGTWELISRYPETFAAAVPICGGGDESAVDSTIAQVHVWAFHGAKDDVVSVSRTRNMVDAFSAKGGTPKYTEYKELGHNSWNNAIAEPELLPWLFSQHKK